MASNGKRRRETPESRFYDTLKGREVTIRMARDGSNVEATLLWVDRYSLGLRVDGKEVLINKRSVDTIERSQPTRERHNGEGDYRGTAL